MKKFYIYIVFLITLLTNMSALADGICNATGTWVNTSGAGYGFGLLQEGDSTISGWWLPYMLGCDRPMIMGAALENGEIILIGFSSQNPGCPMMNLSVDGFLVACDSMIANVWMTGSELGRYNFHKLRSQLLFTEPKKHSVFVISKEPSMPGINAAVMIEFAEEFQRFIKEPQSTPFAWHVIIEYSPRPDRIIYSYISPIFTVNKEHTIDFNLLKDLPSDDGGNGVRGGKLTIIAAYENGLFAKESYEIQGTNPGKALIEQVLTDPVTRGLACTESSYRQFEAKREGGVGMPVLGKTEKGEVCGIGLMQLCLPAPFNNSVWNWRSNINEAKKLLNEKRNDARKAHITERIRLNDERKEMGLPACPIGTPPPLTPEQEDRETLRRYNCGREYRWEPRDAEDCVGKWVIKPTLPSICSDYGYVDKVLSCKIP